MIRLTRLMGQGHEFFLNCELIEHVETTPDTVITLTNGHKFVVEESAERVVEMVKQYKRDISGRRRRGD